VYVSPATTVPGAHSAPTQSSVPCEVVRLIGPQRVEDRDRLAAESPLEIRLGYTTPLGREQRSLSVTMRTPGHDVELAVGFLCSEGIIAAPAQVRYAAPYGPPVDDSGLRNIVQIELEPGVDIDFARLQRNFYTTSSCGVCGKASLEALAVQAPFSVKGDAFTVEHSVLYALPERLRASQRVFDVTGGLHAAALFDAAGSILDVREDVGRHNALDKLIGARFLAGALPLAGLGVLVSGRASFELMQKAVMAGAPMLAAVGAPSSLAAQMASDFGMTLVGFLRDGRCNVYAGASRVR
jgi:FdhD protein